MSLTMWLLLIFGLANDQLRLRAEGLNETCAGHEKWTVFQRRKNGNVDFYRDWEDYVNGFGDCDGDLWLGLEELHQLTKGGNMSLEINMMSISKKDHLVAKYRNFRIGPGSGNYRLYVSEYSGSAGDYLSFHNTSQFSTKDADHDSQSSKNCACYLEGGWWYKDDLCAHSHLNGNFDVDFWWRFDGNVDLCCSEMKIY